MESVTYRFLLPIISESLREPVPSVNPLMPMEVALTPHPRRDLAPMLGITNLACQLLAARTLSVTPPFQHKSTGDDFRMAASTFGISLFRSQLVFSATRSEGEYITSTIGIVFQAQPVYCQLIELRRHVHLLDPADCSLLPV
jgi:hypothetical protein